MVETAPRLEESGVVRFSVLPRYCAAIVAIAMAWAAAGPIARQGPNVLLVTIDTLRADRLGSYGYAPARTPALDALARKGVRFADATAHAVLTYPSHVAILTGRYPGAFGVRLNGMDPLPASAATVAERFKAAGYRTGAVVGSVVVDRSTGLEQGFDDYDDRIRVAPKDLIAKADLQRTASEVTAAARQWIAAQPGAWFLWVHYYDPHLPYDAPAKFAAASAGRPYDAEVAYTDAALGELLSSVDPARTAIAVTADHGEALGDHGEPDHGFFLYDATLHVPLIVAAPGVTPRVVQEQVRSIDVAPTLFDLAGLRADAGDGESLVPLTRGETRRDVPVSIAESWYPRLHFGWSELRAARVGEWKYIAAPKPELYDLRTDRQESRNVFGDRGNVAGRLAADVGRVTSAWKAPDRPPAPQPDAATLERLQALGYVGSLAPAASGSSTENPKDHIAEYRTYRELFNRALGHLAQGRPAQAAADLQRLVKTNVRAFEAHLYLGNAYVALGKSDAALGEYDASSLLNPSLSTPHFEAAKVLSNRGDAAGAAARCATGLALDPQSGYGHYTLGVVHQKAGQWSDAAAAFGRAVELNPADPRAHANLAGASMRLGDLARARTAYEKMVDLEYQVAPAHFNLGVIAARQGDRAEAERRYRLALKSDPAFKPAADALAKIKK